MSALKDRYSLPLMAALLLSASSGVFAHAGPQVRTVLSPEQRAGAVLIANRGLMFGTPNSDSFSLMCNEALGVTVSELPSIVLLSDDLMLAGTTVGLQRTRDHGCTWEHFGMFADVPTPALVRSPGEPGDPDALYLTAYGPGVSGLYVSVDAGEHWQQRLKADDMDYLRFVQIAVSDPKRMYVRKLGLVEMRIAYAVMRSSDAGETWESQTVELASDETDLVLLGVSPSDPNLLVAKAEAATPAGTPERLLLSRDGGETFEEPMRLHSIAAVTWSEDGKTLWLGTDDGLYSSEDEGRTFARVGESVLVSCAEQRAGELYICGYYEGANGGVPGIGVSRDGGKSVDKWMGLTDVLQPIDCAASTPTAETCSPWWADWKREILDSYGVAGASAAAAAGGSGGAPSRAVNTGGTGADVTPATRAQGSSGCQLEHGVTRGALGWFGFGFAVMLVYRACIRRIRRHVARSTSTR